MAGEATHESGREGARRAKAWLESTTRANASWVNPETYAIPKLTFAWADSSGSTFSYDLGGLLKGEDLEGQEFLAEVKYYKRPGNQADLYEEYLAKCYRAYQLRPDRCNNFMWITWCPFAVTKWHNLCSCDEVFNAVLKRSAQALGEPDPVRAGTIIGFS